MKINLDNLKNKNKMKNVILTCLLSFTVISLSFAQLKVVAPDGNVNIGAIGSISAIKKLNIEGGLAVGKGNAQASFECAESAPGSGTWQTSFVHNGNGKFLLRTFKPSSEIQILGKNANNRNRTAFIMKADGKVGIGTATPRADMELKGSVAMKASSGMWVGPSDLRLKSKVEPYKKGIDAILNLNPVTYNYNGKGGIEDTETTHVGLVAQEYQKVAPDAVSSFIYRDYEEIDNANGGMSYKYGAEEEYLKMDPTPILYMLVNAVKDQQEIINNLESQVQKISNGGVNSSPVSDHVHYSTVVLNGQDNKAMLAQNAPNPFTRNTKIDYFIPSNSKVASLSFTDITGKEVKRLNIEHTGLGALDVSIADMPIGIYSYSLVIDGSVIASKKMVLSK